MTHNETSLLYWLNKFNRKERFLLIGYALNNFNFKLSGEFPQILSKTVGLQIPKDAFVAMDYHLDWLHASLYLSHNNPSPKIFEQKTSITISGNQEDVDLIIAFQEDRVTQIIMLEAKGVTSFTNKQLSSKIERLKEIFEDEKKWPGVIPHFVLISPDNPFEGESRLTITSAPKWMKKGNAMLWMPLPIVKKDDLCKIERCNSRGIRMKEVEKGTPATHWKLVSEQKFKVK